jgi:uncharacterized protein (DUF302 family)
MGALDYGYERRLPRADLEGTVAFLVKALRGEGFEVVGVFHVERLLRSRLGVAFPRHRIVGACHPGLAAEILEREPHAGLLLPWNVVVREGEDGEVVVSVIDPKALFALVDGDDLSEAVEDADLRLSRMMDRLDSMTAQSEGDHPNRTGNASLFRNAGGKP